MSLKLITDDVWGALTKAAQQSKKPAHVAVAYFGKGAADLLNLRPESRLVVDASDAAVKSGQTHPGDLQRMLRRKIAVYSAPSLHAKVFAFDKEVFIGSPNVSKHSAEVLQEAIIRIGDSRVIQSARDFIKGLCLEPLGPKALKRLQKLYRPPRFVLGQHRPGGRIQRLSTLRVVQTRAIHVSDRLAQAIEVGHKAAVKKRRHKSGFAIEEFSWQGRSQSQSPFRAGQLVIQVHTSGRRREVSPPGHVIHIQPYRDGASRRKLIYVELPDRDWEPFSRFGMNVRKMLARGGVKNQSSTRTLLELWKK
jgi:hypothetical protein